MPARCRSDLQIVFWNGDLIFKRLWYRELKFHRNSATMMPDLLVSKGNIAEIHWQRQ
jgi:hypothetical protein